MTINHTDIGGDENVARRVLVRARDVAPCVTTLDPESEDGKNAIAILRSIVAEVPAAGSRRTRSMGRNGTTIAFDVATLFTPDDVRDLRALCSQVTGAISGAAAPVGSFPEGGLVASVWPEGNYS